MFLPIIARCLLHPVPLGLGSRLWLPSDLGTKLKCWLKGDSLTGSNGDPITTWSDASGNSNDATGATNKPTLVTSGLNGMNTVAFASASSQYFTVPSGLTNGRTASASFAVYRLSSDPPSGTNGAGPVFGDWGTDALSNHDPWTDGHFYDDYCSTVRKDCGAPTSSTNFRILGFRSQANDWRMHLNGSDQFTTTTNTVGIGVTPNIGFAAASIQYLNGQVAEVVDCNDFLTTGEKERIEGYLAWKWGLQASLPGGHTYAGAAPTI